MEAAIKIEDESFDDLALDIVEGCRDMAAVLAGISERPELGKIVDAELQLQALGSRVIEIESSLLDLQKEDVDAYEKAATLREVVRTSALEAALLWRQLDAVT